MVKKLEMQIIACELNFFHWFCLFGFYGISTIVGYLMPNPVDTYILNKICKHILLITFF